MIGKNISQLRKSRGLSLSEVAERAKISKSYLSNIERNMNKNPSINIVGKISAVLGVDMQVLLNTRESNETEEQLEIEWIDFINELKDSGIDKGEIQEYKTLIEFIKWRNEHVKD